MSVKQTKSSASKSRHFLRGGLPVVCALVVLIFGVPLASAGLQEEAAGVVGSVVESATEPPAPSLPSPAPPVDPPPPTGAPTVPQAPVNVPAVPPVKAPTGITPTSSPSPHLASTPSGSGTRVSSTGANLPLAGERTSAVKGGVADTSMQAARRAPAAVLNGAEADASGPTGPDARPVRAVSLPRWLARVWPAIALVRTMKTLAVLLARWEGATPVSVADDTRGVTSQHVGITGDSDVLGLSKRSDAPHDRFGSPPLAPIPAAGGMSLFLTMITLLLTLVGLIALARLFVGEEFFSPPR